MHVLGLPHECGSERIQRRVSNTSSLNAFTDNTMSSVNSIGIWEKKRFVKRSEVYQSIIYFKQKQISNSKYVTDLFVTLQNAGTS